MTSARPAYKLLASAALARSTQERVLLAERKLDYFQVYFSPANGPRYFVTAGFERAFLSLQTRERKHFVAASAGALRFVTMLISKYTGEDYVRRFEHELCRFSISMRDKPEVVASRLAQLFEGYTDDMIRRLLNDEQHSLNIFVARLKPWIGRSTARRVLAFATAITGNYVHPRSTNLLFDRLCFYTGPPPTDILDTGNVELHPLTLENFRTVLVASAAIPFRVEAPQVMPGVGPGTFVDGGLGDYQLSCRVREGQRALLLSHRRKVVSSWFDTLVPYRPPSGALFENTSVLYPTREFIASMPGRKMPSRRDWDTFRHRPDERYRRWQQCIAMSAEQFPTSFTPEQVGLLGVGGLRHVPRWLLAM